MGNIITIEIKLSQQVVINRIKALTGNQDFAITAPFSGTTDNDKFRINKNNFIVHPFVPVAKGKIKSVDNGSIIDLEFVFPWLGHAAMVTIFMMYVSMPVPLSWGIIVAIIFIWIYLIFSYLREKKDFVNALKKELSEQPQ